MSNSRQRVANLSNTGSSSSRRAGPEGVQHQIGLPPTTLLRIERRKRLISLTAARLTALTIAEIDTSREPGILETMSQVTVPATVPLDAQQTNGEAVDGEEVTLLEDVLPSFEMHNYMFNRTIYDTENISSSGNPPSYEDMNVPSTTSNIAPRDLNNFVDPTKNPNLLLLNNLEKFQKIDLPLTVQVVLTKTVPRLGSKQERENPLRQYRPGEVVCGYITIENKSDDAIPFEMFLVSLEGELTIPHPHKPEELIKKKFLKTYDLSACFHYGCIDLASQGVSLQTRMDELDKSLIGFDNDRVITPKIKHKKFFAFKLPHYLLDTSCFDQLPSHLKLPPSFGVDKSAFKGLAKYIKVDPFLGYGRLDRYGSPIKTNDYAADGQSVSYYISVQFIGRKLDFYKKFYTNDTKHEYDFIFLKNVEYNFRVDTSSNTDEYSADDSLSDISTTQQLKMTENMITDKLHEIVERKNLKKIGITDPRKQDEIIFSNMSNNKKSQQLYRAELVPLLSDTKTSMSDGEGFSRVKTVKLVKDFFSKVEGDMTVRLSMNRNSQLRAIKPKQLKHASSKPSSKSNSSLSLNTQNQLNSNSSSFTSLRSLTLSPTTSSDSVSGLRPVTSAPERLYIYLSFKNPDLKRNTKPNLPSTITFSPSLRVYNIQSPYPIPVTFDNKYLFNGGLEPENLQNLKKKFSFYYQELVDVLKDLDSGLARSMYNKVNGLAKLHVSEQVVKRLFETQTIDLHNQWKFNKERNIYECEFGIPLVFDSKNMEKISSYCVVPGFQQCLLSRLYAVDVEVSIKKARAKMNMKFPVHVV